jgi:hypothetical protein
MRLRLLRWTAAVLAAVCCLARAASIPAIETTYGEDPVPDTACFPGYLNLGYGVDPIPAKTLAQRWREWRAGRTPRANVWGDARPSSAAAGVKHSASRSQTPRGLEAPWHRH